MPDPLLKRVPSQALPAGLAESWQRSMALRDDATLFEVFGNRPDLFSWYIERFYGELFYGGTVPRRIKELVRLRLSTLHGCRFCNQGNRADALAAGVPAPQVEAIGDYPSGPFSDAEVAALRLADRLALTDPNGALDTALYAQLSQHFDDGDILELGMLAGLLAGMAKFMFAFDLVEKEPCCPFHPQET